MLCGQMDGWMNGIDINNQRWFEFRCMRNDVICGSLLSMRHMQSGRFDAVQHFRKHISDYIRL